MTCRRTPARPRPARRCGATSSCATTCRAPRRGGRRRGHLPGLGRPSGPRVGLARGHRRAARGRRLGRRFLGAGLARGPDVPGRFGDPRERARFAWDSASEECWPSTWPPRTSASPASPASARPTSSAPGPDPEAFLAHCRRTGVITSPGFPESVRAWAKELWCSTRPRTPRCSRGDPSCGARLRRPRRPRDGMRGPGRSGHRALRAARRAGGRSLATGRSPSHRRPGGLARAAPPRPSHRNDNTTNSTPSGHGGRMTPVSAKVGARRSPCPPKSVPAEVRARQSSQRRTVRSTPEVRAGASTIDGSRKCPSVAPGSRRPVRAGTTMKCRTPTATSAGTVSVVTPPVTKTGRSERAVAGPT